MSSDSNAVRAVYIARYGRPEVLQERRLPSHEPAPDEVRIRVRASGINFADILQRLGLYASAPRPPYIPGFEVAGEVVAVGKEVIARRRGDRVVAMMRSGGYATEVCVPERALASIPDSLSFEQAAAMPVNYLTAWFCLHEMACLRAGERVLIQGGAGGVGIAALQLARAADAEIIAVAGGPEKVRFLQEAGVDFAIDHTSQQFDVEIRERLGDRPLDVVLDAVGGRTLQRGYELLSPLGRLVSYGLSDAVGGERRSLLATARVWWRTPRFSPLNLIGANVGVFGFHLALLHGREERVASALEEIIGRAESGALSPVIAATFPLDAAGAAEGHRYIHQRRNIGKVLLVLPPETGRAKRP